MGTKLKLSNAVAVAVIGVAPGCGSGTDAVPPESGATEQSVQKVDSPDTCRGLGSLNDALVQLNALKIVEVTGLVTVIPGSSLHCYAGSVYANPEQVVPATLEQSEKLARFVEAAKAIQTPVSEESACTEAAIQQNLNALRALQVVQVSDLVRTHPKNAYNCYGICLDEIERAQEATCTTARKLADLVQALKAQ